MDPINIVFSNYFLLGMLFVACSITHGNGYRKYYKNVHSSSEDRPHKYNFDRAVQYSSNIYINQLYKNAEANPDYVSHYDFDEDDKIIHYFKTSYERFCKDYGLTSGYVGYGKNVRKDNVKVYFLEDLQCNFPNNPVGTIAQRLVLYNQPGIDTIHLIDQPKTQYMEDLAKYYGEKCPEPQDAIFTAVYIGAPYSKSGKPEFYLAKMECI